MSTEFIVIEEEYTDAADDGYRPLVDEFRIVSLVTGDLAGRIRARVGASSDDEVRIVEEKTDTSYSEYTIDWEYAFDLYVGGELVGFREGYLWDKETAIGDLMKWLEGE